MQRQTIPRKNMKPWLRNKPLWAVRIYTKLVWVIILLPLACSVLFTRETIADALSDWWRLFRVRVVE